MSDLVSATVSAASGSLIANLTAKARRIAAAHAQNRLLARIPDGRRWRNARLLWPLSSGD